MEVKDPTTGQMVTVPMRRDLPGYNVTRARKSPRMRWSLPVDIQWQSECIMKFLGQSCACCDVLTGGPNKENEQGKEQLQKQRPRGHDTIIVDSSLGKDIKKKEGKTETTSTTTTKVVHSQKSSTDKVDPASSLLLTRDVNIGSDLEQRLSLQGLDMFPGFPIPNKSAGVRRNRRRRQQLISTNDMLVPQPDKIPSQSGAGQTAFDIMQSQIVSSDIPVKEDPVAEQLPKGSEGGQAPLANIDEEENMDD